MLAELHFEVTIFDFNPDMIKAMTMVRKIKSKEKVVVGDWFKKNISDRYDLITGDTVFNNVKPSQYIKLANIMKSYLKTDGLCLQEICGNFSRQKGQNRIDGLVNKMKSNSKYFNDKKNVYYQYFLYWLAFRKAGLIDAGWVENWAKSQVTDLLSEKEIKKISIDFKWVGSFLDQKWIDNKIGRVFKIIVKIPDNQEKIHRDFYRMYVLSNKNKQS